MSEKQIIQLDTSKPGVFLRELATPADDQIFFDSLQEDPDHVNNFGNSVANTYDTLEKVRDRRLSVGKDIRLGIWDGNQFKGCIGGRVNDNDESQIEIGYWLRKSAVGHGYATVATQAITSFLSSKYERVFAEVNEDNIASAKVLERAGYTQTAEVDRDWGHMKVFEAPK